MAAKRQSAQQVRVDGMLGMGPAGVRTPRHALQSHDAHEPLPPLAVDLMPLGPERHRHSPAAVVGALEVERVDATHELQLLVAHLDGLVVHAMALAQLRQALLLR